MRRSSRDSESPRTASSGSSPTAGSTGRPRASPSAVGSSKTTSSGHHPSSSPTAGDNHNPDSTGSEAQALLDLANLRPDELAAAVAAAAASAVGDDGSSTRGTGSTAGSSSGAGSTTNSRTLRPDLVRLSDIVTHASMVLAQAQAQAQAGDGAAGGNAPGLTPGLAAGISTGMGVSLGPSGAKKYRRSRNGCLSCRQRKVKCDEVRPRCLRCAGMGRECVWEKDDKIRTAEPRKAAEGGKPRKKSLASGVKAVPVPGPSKAVPVSGPGKAVPQTTTQMQNLNQASTQAQNIAQTSVPQVRPIHSSSFDSKYPHAFNLDDCQSAGAGIHLDGSSLTQALAELVALAPTLRAHLPGAAGPSSGSGLSSASSAAAAASTSMSGAPSMNHTANASGQTDAAAAIALMLAHANPTPNSNANHGTAISGPHAPPPPVPSPFALALAPWNPESAMTTTHNGTRRDSGIQDTAMPWDEFFSGSTLDWTTNALNGESTKDNDAMDTDDVIELPPSTSSSDQSNGRVNLRLSTSFPQPHTPLTLSLGQIAARRRSQPHRSMPVRVNHSDLSNTATHPRFQVLTGGSNDNPHVGVPRQPLDPFMHAFPTASAQSLFRHYVDNTASIVTAMGRIKPGQNPFLAVSLPLVLADTSSPACAALRFSLLTTSAAHILHLRGGNAQDVAELGERLKRLAIGYTIMSQASDCAEDADLVLAACCILTTRDVLNADRTWRSNFDFAIACVRRRGGPEQLMGRDPTSFTKRFVLEQLATHEVFSCFTTGGEPTFLVPNSAWWFDIEKSSHNAWEWESVEMQFGISRAMVEVVARTIALCSRRNRLGPASLDDPDLAPVANLLHNEAEALISELDVFGVALRSLPFHQRVQMGDHIYRISMQLHLMSEILGLGADDPRVRRLVPAALEMCSETSMQPVMLVWPLLIISKACARGEEREWMLSLLETYAVEYCRDLQTAKELIEELWKRQDEGKPPIAWHNLMTETGKVVLLI